MVSPRTTLTLRRSSARNVRIALAGYGLVLALVAGVHFHAATPDGIALVGVERQRDIPESLAVLDRGGPPFLRPDGTPISVIDDPGLYLYVPLLGHAVGLDDPAIALKWLLISLFLPLLVVYPLVFFELFRSVLAGLVAPLVLLLHELRFYDRITEVYWLTAWAIFACMPPLLLLARKRWTWVSIVALAAVNVLASFAGSIRGSAGLPIALASVMLVFLSERGWWRRAGAIAVVGVSFAAVTTFTVGSVTAARNAYADSSAPAPHGATPWHTAYIGLGYLDNPYGIRGGDDMVFRHAKNVEPDITYFGPGYDETVRRMFFDRVEDDPAFFARTVAIKTGVALQEGPFRFWLGPLLVLGLLLFGRDRGTARRIALVLVPAVVVTFFPPTLYVPAPQYLEGWRASWILVELVGLAWLASLVPAGIRRLSPLLERLRGRWFEVFEWEVGLPEPRSVLRSPALWGGLALALVLAGATREPYLRAVDRAEAEFPFLQFQSPLIPDQELKGPIYQAWSFAGGLPQGWEQSGRARVQRSRNGVRVSMDESVAPVQLRSPQQLLPAGEYRAVVDGKVLGGGLILEAANAVTGVRIAAAQYYEGEYSARQPRAHRMATVLRLAEPTVVRLVLWKSVPFPKATAWFLRGVRIVSTRVPDAAGVRAFYRALASPLADTGDIAGTTVANWSFAAGLPDGWEALPGVRARAAAGGTRFLSAARRTSTRIRPDVRSPAVALEPGTYRVFVRGHVAEGGLQLALTSESGDTPLGTSFFWAGQAPFDRSVMTTTTDVTESTRVGVSLANWSPTLRPSSWLVTQVGIARIEFGRRYRDVVLADTPAAYWRLEQRARTGARSAVGDARCTYGRGVTSGVAGALPGRSDAAISLGGLSGVRCRGPSLARRFTIEVWAYLRGPGSVGQTEYATLAGLGRAKRLLWSTADGKLLAQLAGDFFSTRPASLDAWHHIVYTFDGRLARFYVDGAPAGSQRTEALTWPARFWLGGYGEQHYLFNGRIDEVALYERALTTADVRRHYEASGVGAP